jgi:FixJ family two-component response regulator
MQLPRVVALVDDNPNVLEATANLLSTYGVKTEQYASAELFLEAAAGSRACFLVVDIDLGGMNGIELARQLAERGLKFPIIFATARDDEAVRQRAEQVGCVAFLRKPFFPGVLIEILLELKR